MSTAFSQDANPVLNLVALDYIRVATWDFKIYLDLAAKVRKRYVGWRPSKWLQYKMQRSQDKVSYGIGEQGGKAHGIFEASGAAAHEFMTWLDCTQRDIIQALYATRIDLQSTKHRHPDLDYIKTHKRLAKPKQIIIGDDGSTLYIGNRESASFWRLYDKSPGTVRLEVELKSKQAAKCFRALVAGVTPATYYNSLVASSRVPKYLADYYGDGTDVVDLDEFLQKEPEDMNKKLQWLHTLDSLVWKLANDHDTGDATRELIERWADYVDKA